MPEPSGEGGLDQALPAAFFDRPAAIVARALLGCHLVSECGGDRAVGRIVETEAYPGPEDPAGHAAASVGRTARNDPLFGPPGIAYIHLNYGVHWCLNVVTGEEGHPAGVLIRALEPLTGREVMRRRRGRAELTNGPARLTQALGIGPQLQRHPLDRPPLWMNHGSAVPERRVVVTTRIGISKGTDLRLRFYDDESRWISRR
ncbi:MAG: DNA-3-methyladenine glycosylase [Gemmatimonadota bacterium]